MNPAKQPNDIDKVDAVENREEISKLSLDDNLFDIELVRALPSPKSKKLKYPINAQNSANTPNFSSPIFLIRIGIDTIDMRRGKNLLKKLKRVFFRIDFELISGLIND